MEWYWALLLIFGTLVALMATALPVAFCFMLLNILGALWFWGGLSGIEQLILSMYNSVTSFTLLSIPLFVLMGEVMFQSGVAPKMMDVLDKWLGRLPGRLALLAVGGGTIFATLSGSTVASVAMLGSVLVPEMEKRGYKKAMSLGAILGSGGLAMMIPPTMLGVLLAAIAEISIGKLLIAIIIPGLLMAAFYSAYIILRCYLQPSIAPAYEVTTTPLSEKLMNTVRYVLPLGLIIFLVTGIIFLGVATPDEAAATGTLGTFILAAAYKGLNWGSLKRSLTRTIQSSLMVLLIVSGAKAFGEIIAFSGATRGLGEFASSLPLAPIFIIVAIQVAVIFLGMFMSVIAIMMITLPIFMPVVINLGFDPVWFGAIMLLNIELASISPPFGMNLFVMRGVATPDTTMGDVFQAALPYVMLDLIVMALMIAFPPISLWLPSIMR